MVELKVGGQYKTSGGRRCVVVSEDGAGDFLVWHEEDEDTKYHNSAGLFMGKYGSEFAIVSEWKEPKSGEFWVVVDRHGQPWTFDDKFTAESAAYSEDMARLHIKWTEGDGL